jgi:hypothetical protein
VQFLIIGSGSDQCQVQRAAGAATGDPVCTSLLGIK